MKYSSWLIVIILVLSQVSCISDKEYSQDEVKALMQSELERRIRNFKEVRWQRCYDQMLAEAVRRADSIMVAKAREAVPDPGRPGRPERPAQRTAKDSIPVKPLFERDSLFADTSKVMHDSTGKN